ncbi:hypothetical protein N1031_00885 [Herbiconiux moechotypicola]|uniref:Modulator of FtsH protease n=1 Tax=Herbiconiux moechotypicola TaxID=637393 RepID=A0ABN3D846_9MICO|nr:hypothetical protein [Herbiconiux moechotypicola]MCS5728307.1 hypothetical protein [Herbiconiux moechotypicola]
MDTSLVDGWSEFAVASAGAAAALAGLLIVAISVNVKEIISGAALPSRAGATIASVVVILLGSTVMLIPGQPAVLLGLELAVFALIALGLQIDAATRMFAHHVGAGTLGRLLQTVLGVGAQLWVVVGGAAVAFGSGWGLYLVAVGFVAIFAAAVLNAWVLMIEILR